jgi:hypothetical protein
MYRFELHECVKGCYEKSIANESEVTLFVEELRHGKRTEGHIMDEYVVQGGCEGHEGKAKREVDGALVRI